MPAVMKCEKLQALQKPLQPGTETIKLTAQREAFHRRVQLLAGSPVRVVRLEAAVVQVQGLVPLPVDALAEQEFNQFALRSRSIRMGNLLDVRWARPAPWQSRRTSEPAAARHNMQEESALVHEVP